MGYWKAEIRHGDGSWQMVGFPSETRIEAARELRLAKREWAQKVTPAEVAEFLVYLSSDRVRQVTGQVFHFESRPF